MTILRLLEWTTGSNDNALYHINGSLKEAWYTDWGCIPGFRLDWRITMDETGEIYDAHLIVAKPIISEIIAEWFYEPFSKGFLDLDLDLDNIPEKDNWDYNDAYIILYMWRDKWGLLGWRLGSWCLILLWILVLWSASSVQVLEGVSAGVSWSGRG